MTRHLLSGLLALALTGCGDGGDAGSDGDADADSDADSDADADGDADADADDAPRFDAAPSTILVTEYGDGLGGQGGSSIGVLLYATAPPAFHTEIAREGACRLSAWEPAFCDPYCENGTVCMAEGTCVPWPALLVNGTVSVSGTTGGPRTLEPDPRGGLWWSDGPGDLFAPGEPVVVDVEASDDVPAFQIQSTGVAPLAHDFVTNFEPLPSGDFEITWEPSPMREGRVRAHLITDYAHGTPPVVVDCDSADDGSMVIPAAFVEELRDPSHWSCGDCISSAIERYSRATTTVGDLEVELVVNHTTRVYLRPAY